MLTDAWPNFIIQMQYMIMLIQDEARQLQQLISFDFEFLHLVLNASLLERGRYFVFSLQECPYEAVMAIYDGRGNLEEGETAEARFIKIQAAYELLIDGERRRQYDVDNRVNPMKASQAWMDWLIKKRKAFDQRGDMAIVAWAEQQQRELNLRVRQLSHSKTDPEEARKILAREKKASADYYSNTLKRHTLVLKKRDLMRRKAEEEKKTTISRLLAAEGLELDDSDSDEAL